MNVQVFYAIHASIQTRFIKHAKNIEIRLKKDYPYLVQVKAQNQSSLNYSMKISIISLSVIINLRDISLFFAHDHE